MATKFSQHSTEKHINFNIMIIILHIGKITIFAMHYHTEIIIISVFTLIYSISAFSIRNSFHLFCHENLTSDLFIHL